MVLLLLALILLGLTPSLPSSYLVLLLLAPLLLALLLLGLTPTCLLLLDLTPTLPSSYLVLLLLALFLLGLTLDCCNFGIGSQTL